MKRIFSNLLFLFLPALLAVFIFSLALPVQAAEGDCHIDYCFVPTPTILGLEQNSSLEAKQFFVKGLTWREAIVEVYLDGKLLTNTIQVEHKDQYGSFYAKPNFKLKPGKHFVYVMAHSRNPGWGDQSKESAYIYFTIKESFAKPIVKNEVLPEKPLDSQATATSTQVNVLSPATSTIKVEVNTGKIEGGVSLEANPDQSANPDLMQDQESAPDVSSLQQTADISQVKDELDGQITKDGLAKTQQRNRIIGFVLLGLIILATLAYSLINKARAKKEQAGLILNNYQPEILDQAKNDHNQYWAAPGNDPNVYQSPDDFFSDKKYENDEDNQNLTL